MMKERYNMSNKEEKSCASTSINWYKPNYGKLLYEAINKEIVMKKIENRYTNNIFENIKHIDEYGNEYWYARELSKILEYKDWRNFLKVLNKAKDACKNSGFNIDEQLVEVNKEIIMPLLIYKIINFQDIYVI